MNNDYRPDGSGWYAPLARETETSAPVPAPEEKKKGLPAMWRVLLGTLLVLGLIVGSSLAFSNRGEKPANTDTEKNDVLTDPGSDDSFGFFLPDGLPGFSWESDGKEELPEDWKDFFNSYYTTESSGKTDSRIQKVEESSDWRLEVKPAGKEEITLQELYRDCVESIVSVRSYEADKLGYYWGTGIVMSEDGLILINAHMIEDCDTATVVLNNNEEYEAKLVGADNMSDIAVLKIEAHGLKAAVFGDSDELSVGESVAAIGNPLGEEFRATLTNGIVSAIDRGMSYGGHSLNLIQTNTAINEGSSGGALLNMYGQVIGVTNMKMMSNYSSIEGIGFAIPSTTVRSIVNALMKDGEVRGRPALGVTVGAITSMAAEHYALPDGLYINEVSENSDAYEKGIKPGDIITAINGEPVKTTEDVVKIRDTLAIGDSMTMTVWRDGVSEDIEIILGEYNDIY